jgi:hypothetical protein
MVEESVREKLRERYSHIHPAIFHRSCECANSAGDLFDILEGIPQRYPIFWSDRRHQWVTVKDIRKIIGD